MAEVTGLDDFDPLRAVALGEQIQGQRARQDLGERRLEESIRRQGVAETRLAEQDQLDREQAGLDMVLQAMGKGYNAFRAAVPLIRQSGFIDAEDEAALLALEESDMPRAASDLQGRAAEIEQQFIMLDDPNISEDQKRAIRISLGLDPRAVGSSDLTITREDLADEVARTVTTLAAAGALGGQAAEVSGDAFEQLGAINNQIGNYDEAIRALDEGAQTGPVISRFPSISESGARLEAAANRLGLDIISQTTFGALSEGELRLALQTAVPTNLPPDALRDWLVARRDAQQKLSRELRRMAIFLGTPGNTVAMWLEQEGGGGNGGGNAGGGENGGGSFTSSGGITIEVQ